MIVSVLECPLHGRYGILTLWDPEVPGGGPYNIDWDDGSGIGGHSIEDELPVTCGDCDRDLEYHYFGT